MLTAGWRKVATDTRAGGITVGRVVAFVWAVALVVPVLVQVQLFPYAYTYAAPYADALAAALAAETPDPLPLFDTLNRFRITRSIA